MAGHIYCDRSAIAGSGSLLTDRQDELTSASIRVMTWNLLWRFGEWRKRQPLIRAVIAAQSPDVVGLQEAWGDAGGTQVTALAQESGMHAAFAAPSLPVPPEAPERPDQAGVEVGVGILSRWPIVATREYRLASGHRPYVVALGATVDHPLGQLHFVTTCLDWAAEFADHRLDQARQILAIATDPALDGPLPVVVVGDMNAPPKAAEIRALSDGMLDAWVEARTKDASDADGVTLSGSNPLAPQRSWLIDKRIDYIFLRSGSGQSRVWVNSCAVVAGGSGALPASDHSAVVADIGVVPDAGVVPRSASGRPGLRA